MEKKIDNLKEEGIDSLKEEAGLMRVFNIIERLRVASGFLEKHYICTPMLRLAIRLVESSNEITHIPSLILNVFKQQLMSKELESNEAKKLAVREFLFKCLEIAVKNYKTIPYAIMVINYYTKMYFAI
jgi:hypothetical protein